MFTFYLGGVRKRRIPLESVIEQVRRVADSFTIQEATGFFQGEPDPGWAVQIASDEPPLMLRLAKELRAAFSQEGIGISVCGRYVRLTEGTNEGLMLDSIQDLQKATSRNSSIDTA
jgi:hypothetical protein